MYVRRLGRRSPSPSAPCAKLPNESLRDVLLNSGLSLPQVGVQIFPKEEDGGKFDGEAHIETKVVNWSSQDLILLDPFAMWREKEDQPQRDRYRSGTHTTPDRTVLPGRSQQVTRNRWYRIGSCDCQTHRHAPSGTPGSDER